MAEKSDYTDIKAGVDGMIGDVPSPNQEIDEAPSPTEEMPTTEISSEGNTQEYQQPSLTDYGNQPTQGSGQTFDSERMHQIVEAIVSEKWDELMNGVGNLAVWKEKINNDVIAIKQEILRINDRFENLQNAILGRVKEYDQGIQGIHTEMKALEKVFEKIIEPLTSNIKELDRLVNDMKKK